MAKAEFQQASGVGIMRLSERELDAVRTASVKRDLRKARDFLIGLSIVPNRGVPPVVRMLAAERGRDIERALEKMRSRK